MLTGFLTIECICKRRAPSRGSICLNKCFHRRLRAHDSSKDGARGSPIDTAWALRLSALAPALSHRDNRAVNVVRSMSEMKALAEGEGSSFYHIIFMSYFHAMPFCKNRKTSPPTLIWHLPSSVSYFMLRSNGNFILQRAEAVVAASSFIAKCVIEGRMYKCRSNHRCCFHVAY